MAEAMQATNGKDGGVRDRNAGETLSCVAPASGEVYDRVAITSPEEVQATVARARRAQRAWAAVPLDERCERIVAFRDAIVQRSDELVSVLSKETGKPRHEALMHEVFAIADLTSYYAAQAPRILAPHAIAPHLLLHRRSTVHYVPRGVVGIISPWNFPFTIPMGDVIAALVTGSAAVVKPSEATPLVLLKAKEIYDSTGLPQDLFSVVPGRGPTGAALIDSGIDKLVFTGGVETGKKVAAACGARLIPCVMELGGKAPLIACSDCDVEYTARAIAFGGFANSGQVCISVERVYAHKDVYDALVNRVAELVRALRQGDPETADVDVGSMTFAPQLAIVERHIQDAVAKGARVVTGGMRPKDARGLFFPPTVLANCTDDMTVLREEIFGPIVPFRRVDSEEEAVRLANDSYLGLNAYVFTRNAAKGERIALQVEAGSVLVNEVLINHAMPETPFGGVKQSGFGRVHGDDALRDLCEKRHVNVGTFPVPLHKLLWFPYSAAKFRFLTRAMRAVYTRGSTLQRIRRIF